MDPGIVLPSLEIKPYLEVEQPKSPLHSLSDEILLLIFRNLTGLDLGKTSLTCRKFQRVANDAIFGKLLRSEKFHQALLRGNYQLSTRQVPKGHLYLSYFKGNKALSFFKEERVILGHLESVVLVDPNLQKENEEVLIDDIKEEEYDLCIGYKTGIPLQLGHAGKLYQNWYCKEPVYFRSPSESMALQTYTENHPLYANHIIFTDIANITGLEGSFDFEDPVRWVGCRGSKISIVLKNGDVQIWESHKIFSAIHQFRQADGRCHFIFLKATGHWVDRHAPGQPIPDLKPEKITQLSATGVRCAELVDPYLFLLDDRGVLNVYQWPDCTLLKSFPETLGASSLKVLPDGKIVLGWSQKVEIFDFLPASAKITRSPIGHKVRKTFAPLILKVMQAVSFVFKCLAAIDQFLKERLPVPLPPVIILLPTALLVGMPVALLISSMNLIARIALEVEPRFTALRQPVKTFVYITVAGTLVLSTAVVVETILGG